jgi:Na+-driven multidrug efflux pump
MNGETLQAADPGWKPALAKPHIFLLMWMLPTVAFHMKVDGLTRVRIVWLSSLLSLAGVYVITALILGDPEGEKDRVLWSAITAGVGCIELALIFFFRKRAQGQAKDAEQFGKTYVQTFFIGYALGMSPALVGFVAVFLTDALTAFYIGSAVSIVALAMIAPTKREIDKWSRAMQHRGIQGSFVQAVITTPPSGR